MQRYYVDSSGNYPTSKNEVINAAVFFIYLFHSNGAVTSEYNTSELAR